MKGGKARAASLPPNNDPQSQKGAAVAYYGPPCRTRAPKRTRMRLWWRPIRRHRLRRPNASRLLGRRGMSCPPDDDFRFLDDLYAVRSAGKPDDGCLLLFDPKNARR